MDYVTIQLCAEELMNNLVCGERNENTSCVNCAALKDMKQTLFTCICIFSDQHQ